MGKFVELRELALALARYYASGDGVASDETRKCAEVIEKELSTFHFDSVPGHLSSFAPHIEPEFEVVRAEWNNIAISDNELESVESELEAAWALTFAWGQVLYDCHVSDNDNLLDEMFGLNIESHQKDDSVQWLQMAIDQKRDEKWPVTLLLGAMGFAVAFGDTMSGNDGTASAMFGLAGIAAIAYAAFQWRNLRKLYERKEALSAKWNGPPTREMPTKLFENF